MRRGSGTWCCCEQCDKCCQKQKKNYKKVERIIGLLIIRLKMVIFDSTITIFVFLSSKFNASYLMR